MPLNFEKYTSKANELLKEVADELNDPGNKTIAGKLLKGVLHTLRDVISMEESLQFISELPMIFKGIYVDGWTPMKHHDRIKTVEEFVDRVYKKAAIGPKTSFQGFETDEEVVKVVISVLRRHISKGEIADVRAGMPKGLIELWDEPIWLL